MIQQSGEHFFDSDLQNLFNLKQHLQEFLNLDAEILDSKMKTGFQEMTELGHKEFDWDKATTFYRDRVKELYLFELGNWHLSIHERIANMLRLIADHAQGQVLDFGGGIGTHAIGAALCPQVKQVTYCDINPRNIEFVHYRANKLGLSDKIRFCSEIPAQESFDTILCFDVLEHLPDPSQQLLKFHQVLTPEGKIIVHWFFSKGRNNEHPFHLDDPQAIDTFFRTLQSSFIEIFHAYDISARCYRQWI